MAHHQSLDICSYCHLCIYLIEHNNLYHSTNTITNISCHHHDHCDPSQSLTISHEPSQTITNHQRRPHTSNKPVFVHPISQDEFTHMLRDTKNLISMLFLPKQIASRLPLLSHWHQQYCLSNVAQIAQLQLSLKQFTSFVFWSILFYLNSIQMKMLSSLLHWCNLFAVVSLNKLCIHSVDKCTRTQITFPTVDWLVDDILPI